MYLPANRETHTCMQCSSASVGFAQASLDLESVHNYYVYQQTGDGVIYLQTINRLVPTVK